MGNLRRKLSVISNLGILCLTAGLTVEAFIEEPGYVWVGIIGTFLWFILTLSAMKRYREGE